MTAARVFRTSPPEPPGKLTCHTSPRRIEPVADKRFAPFAGFRLAVRVGGHLRISGRQAVGHHKGPGQIFEEFPDKLPKVLAWIGDFLAGSGRFPTRSSCIACDGAVTNHKPC